MSNPINIASINNLRPQALLCSQYFDVEVELILAIVWQESSGDVSAIRFEPGYYNNVSRRCDVERFAKLNAISTQTESALQCFSFGPMQVMGLTARKLGFTSHLIKLLSADFGMSMGTHLLSTLIKPGAPIEDAIASYNHGSPEKKSDGTYVVQSYVDSVMRNYTELRNKTQ